MHPPHPAPPPDVPRPSITAFLIPVALLAIASFPIAITILSAIVGSAFLSLRWIRRLLVSRTDGQRRAVDIPHIGTVDYHIDVRA